MTERELLEDINNEITFSGMIPYSLPDKELKRILENDTKYFYDNWRHAVEPQYILLPTALFGDPAFKANRQITLPDCVQAVIEFKETRGNSILGTIDRDFGEQKFIGSEVYLTPFIGESIMYRTTIFSFLDLTKAFVLDTVSYDFNKNSKKLTVVGRSPKVDAVIKVLKKLDKEYLYKDELFQRYVRAHSKVRLAQMLQTFNYTLPGEITLNYQTITQAATAEMTEVTTMMAKENTPDWLFLTRQ
jgi:hypothetical protein